MEMSTNKLKQQNFAFYFNDSQFMDGFLDKKESMMSQKQISNIKIDSLLIDHNQVTFTSKLNNKPLSRNESHQNVAHNIESPSKLKSTGKFNRIDSQNKLVELNQALGLNDSHNQSRQCKQQVENTSFYNKKLASQSSLNSDSALRSQISQLKKSNEDLKHKYNELALKFVKITENIKSNYKQQQNSSHNKSTSDPDKLNQKLKKSQHLITSLQNQMQFLHIIKQNMNQKLNICYTKLKQSVSYISILEAKNKQLKQQIMRHRQYNRDNIKKILALENNLNQLTHIDRNENIYKNNQLREGILSENEDEQCLKNKNNYASKQMLDYEVKRLKQKNIRYQLKIKRYKAQKQQLSIQLMNLKMRKNKENYITIEKQKN